MRIRVDGVVGYDGCPVAVMGSLQGRVRRVVGESWPKESMVDGNLFFMLPIQPFNFIGRGRETLQDNGWFEDGVKFFVGGMFVM